MSCVSENNIDTFNRSTCNSKAFVFTPKCYKAAKSTLKRFDETNENSGTYFPRIHEQTKCMVAKCNRPKL